MDKTESKSRRSCMCSIAIFQFTIFLSAN